MTAARRGQRILEEGRAIMPSEFARVSEVVLLVEDEAKVREVLQAALEAAGYTVLVAGDGEEHSRSAVSTGAPLTSW